MSGDALRTLRVDPARALLDAEVGTGIYVRAIRPDTGRWGNADILELERASLDAWLRSRDSIEWPIGVVMVLLGHELILGGQEQ